MAAPTGAAPGEFATLGRPADLPFLDVHTDAFRHDRVRYLRAARERSWLFRSERGVEVLGYAPHAELLRDRRLSQDHSLVALASGITDPEVWRFRTHFLTSTTGRTHARLRAVVAPYFGKHHVDSLRGTVRGLIEDLVDDLPRDRPVDLFETVCTRISAMTYALLVGAPLEDEGFIISMSDSVLQIFKRDPSVREVVEAAYAELFPYIRRRYAACEAEPGGDLLSRLVAAVAEGKLSRQEALDLAVLLLEASTDNTAHQMALSAAALLESPEQWHDVVADQGLLPAAVEETIRFRPRTVVNDRVAMEDLSWRGLEVPKGTRFTLSTLSAHDDPEAFLDPGSLDIHRPDPRPTVMFGGGITVCLGMNLARMEIEEFLRVLATRRPGVRLAGPADWEMLMYRAECRRLEVYLPG